MRTFHSFDLNEPLTFIAPGWLNVNHKASPFYNLRPQVLNLKNNQGEMLQTQNIIDTLIIHNISLPPSEWGGEWVHHLFQGKLPSYLDEELNHPYLIMVKNFEVSSHFMIDRNGDIFQYVSTDLRAWHAGKSSLTVSKLLNDNLDININDGAGKSLIRENCNDFSIGIELEGDDFSAFTDSQYLSLQKLIHALISYYPIKYCAAHSYIAPDRKTDPGPFFDWARLQKSIMNINHINNLSYFYD